MRPRSRLTAADTKRVASEVARRINLEIAGKPQAEVNSINSTAVADLIQALETVPSACIVIGTLAIVKTQMDGETQVTAKDLTALEMRALARYPTLRKHPSEFFAALNDSIRALLLELDDNLEGSSGIS
jgi:hypothetical protein